MSMKIRNLQLHPTADIIMAGKQWRSRKIKSGVTHVCKLNPGSFKESLNHRAWQCRFSNGRYYLLHTHNYRRR